MDFAALFLFLVLMIGTPGPANMVAMATGARYGFFACLPFITGIVGGMALLNLVFVAGLSSILLENPRLETIITFIAAAYVLWLCTRMWREIGSSADDRSALPRLIEGLPIHPLNPKAWAMAIVAWTGYQPDGYNPITIAIILMATFFVIQCFAHSLWCLGGATLSISAKRQETKLIIQRVLAVATAATVLFVIVF